MAICPSPSCGSPLKYYKTIRRVNVYRCPRSHGYYILNFPTYNEGMPRPITKKRRLLQSKLEKILSKHK